MAVSVSRGRSPFRLTLTGLHFTFGSPFVPVNSRHFVASRLSRTFDFPAVFLILTLVPVIPRGTIIFCDFPGVFLNFASKICQLLAGFYRFCIPLALSTSSHTLVTRQRPGN